MNDLKQKLRIIFSEAVDLIIDEIVNQQITQDKEAEILNRLAENSSSNSINTDKLLIVSDVAEILEIKERTIYEWVRRGKIPFKKLGSSVRFSKTEIQEWVDTK